MDVLGRLKQVEEMNWDTSVYSTTSYTYNARDQITQTNQAGQIRTLEYDGFARLWRRTTPEQGATTYSYNTDDTVQTITDARGATTTYAYNSRHLPTNITYGVPAGVAATSNVTFEYDSAGNRTRMLYNNGQGQVLYSYDQLSRLTSESRYFGELGASFALNYQYNLAGELTNITNPWNAQVGYSYDKMGRPTAVTGSGYSGVSSYVNSISYRAFAMKQMSYANGKTLSINYDNRMRMTRWDVAGVLGSDYEYRWEDTFRPTFAHSRTDATLDRWYNYDHVGRLHIGRSGSEARAAYGEPFNGQYDGPYSMGIYYDVWGNITLKEGWGGENPAYTASYTNNRRNGSVYDAAGNITSEGSQTFAYDATGQQTYASATGLTQSYDGDGLRFKKTESGVTTYYLRSSVLGGQVVAELNSSGALARGFVYLGGQMVAIQSGNAVSWVHQDPVTKSQRVTNSSGTVVSTIELDPWGGDTSRSSNQAFQPKRFTSYDRDVNGSDEAMFRRYNRWHGRFDQPDPYDGSYNLTDPQSFNRYAYVQNDPVNFVDPTGLDGTPGEICPGGVIGNDGKCYEGEVPIVTVQEEGPSSRDLPISHEWGGFQPLPVVSNPRDIFIGGGDGGLGSDPPTGERQGQESHVAKVAACYARCLTKNRQDNVIREVGNAAGYPRVGEFAAQLTIAGTAAATVNQALNLTSLGRYPRGGVGGGSRAGMPTTWQHRLGGALGRHVGRPLIGTFARGLGRGSNAIGIGMLAAEGGWWQGIQATCAVLCARDPLCY